VRARRFEVRLTGCGSRSGSTVTVEAEGPLSAALAAFLETCGADPHAISLSDLRVAERGAPLVVVIDDGSGDHVTARVRVLADP
jgi:hypothetical protein